MLTVKILMAAFLRDTYHAQFWQWQSKQSKQVGRRTEIGATSVKLDDALLIKRSLFSQSLAWSEWFFKIWMVGLNDSLQVFSRSIVNHDRLVKAKQWFYKQTLQEIMNLLINCLAGISCRRGLDKFKQKVRHLCWEKFHNVWIYCE